MTDVSKYTLRVTWDQVDSLVVDELKNLRDNMKNDMEADVHFGIFESDPELDREIIRKHYDAAVLLLSYYGVEE